MNHWLATRAEIGHPHTSGCVLSLTNGKLSVIFGTRGTGVQSSRLEAFHLRLEVDKLRTGVLLTRLFSK
jgi:hypothetical protein